MFKKLWRKLFLDDIVVSVAVSIKHDGYTHFDVIIDRDDIGDFSQVEEDLVNQHSDFFEKNEDIEIISVLYIRDYHG
jgi:hypothetical protein